MDAKTKKRLDGFISFLRKEARLPLANRFLSEETAEVVAQSWFNKSWSDMMHDDLVEEGDRLHYHRTLNKACKNDVPNLLVEMEKNVYAATILDLVEQEKVELESYDDVDPLYLLEMALGLAQMDTLQPVHVHLLKMVSFHQDKFGSLNQLRGKSSPRDVARMSMKSEDHEDEKHIPLEAIAGFEYVEPDETSSDRINAVVVEMWMKFEDQVGVNVTRLLQDSRSMKQVKAELWQRQETSEAILVSTEEECEDTIIQDQFLTDLESKLPAFRREMGKKIAANPKLAEKIYDVLDKLVLRQISAFEYLDVAVDLARSDKEAIIDVIRLDLIANGNKYLSHLAIRETLDGIL